MILILVLSLAGCMANNKATKSGDYFYSPNNQGGHSFFGAPVGGVY